MFSQKLADTFTAIGLKQPADFVPCAKLKRPLDDQVSVACEIKPFNIVFLKIRLQPNRDSMQRERVLHVDIITLKFLPLPIQHHQPHEADQDPNHVDPRNLVLEYKYRHRDEDERCNHICQHGGDTEIPTGAVHEQKAEFDTHNSNGKQKTRPIQLPEFSDESVLNGEKEEANQCDSESDPVRHQQRNRKVHLVACQASIDG